MNEEKRRRIERFEKKGLPREEAEKLVHLTEAKDRGQISPNDEQKLAELQTQLSLLLTGAT